MGRAADRAMEARCWVNKSRQEAAMIVAPAFEILNQLTKRTAKGIVNLMATKKCNLGAVPK